MARNTTARLLTPARRAFTLIELLVVVGIIGVLVGLTLFVGKQVVGGGKQKTAQQVIQVLDQALQAYIASTGDNPPAVHTVGTGATALHYPVADARDMNATAPVEAGVFPGGHPMVNSVGLFYEQGRKIDAVSKILDKIPQQYVKMYDIDGAGPQPAMMTVFDPWGKPIRYVHPAFQGVYSDALANTSPNAAAPRPTLEVWPLQPTAAVPTPVYQITDIRRNNVPTGTGVAAENQADGDGGMCVGNRPYFYSLGPDGLCGVVKDSATPAKVVENRNTDNVYTTVPNFVDK